MILLDRPVNATREFLAGCFEAGVGIFSLGPVVENLSEARMDWRSCLRRRRICCTRGRGLRIRMRIGIVRRRMITCGRFGLWRGRGWG